MADPTSNPAAGTAPGNDQAQAAARPATQGAAAAPSPGEALASARKVEELADQLSACADAIHARATRDVHRFPNGVPDAEQAAALALLDDEQVLRQRADQMYADAAACIVSSLGQSQQHLIQLTADAAAKIRTITRLGDGISLAARMVGLAAAAASGQGLAVMAALNALQAQLAVIAAHNPPAPPAPSPVPDASV